MNSTSRTIGGDCTRPSSAPATVGSALAVGPGPALGSASGPLPAGAAPFDTAEAGRPSALANACPAATSGWA